MEKWLGALTGNTGQQGAKNIQESLIPEVDKYTDEAPQTRKFADSVKELIDRSNSCFRLIRNKEVCRNTFKHTSLPSLS